MTTTIETENASAGTSKLSISTGTCKGFGFGMGGCSVTADGSTGSPWPFHVAGTDRLSIVGTSFDLTASSCLLTESEFTFSEITATVNNTEEIGSISISGSGTAETNVGGGSVTLSGTLTAGGTSGTYQINGKAKEDDGKGVLRDVSSNNPIANGARLHLAGWIGFELLGSGMECHVTSEIEAVGNNGETGRVLSLTLETASCFAYGSIYEGCQLVTDSVEGLPYSVNVAPTDFEITGGIFVASELEGCEFEGLFFTDLAYERLTLLPLKTGSNEITNTAGNLGATASSGEPIAGFEIEAEGEAENDFGTFGNILKGELELSSPERCTYKLTAS